MIEHGFEGEEYKRAIHITSLNEGIAMYTNDKNETMDYLIEKAVQTLKIIKDGNDG